MRPATFRAIITRFIEGIPTIRAVRNQLKFKLSLGFLYSERIPSEASFSRIFKTLGDNLGLLNDLNDKLLEQINKEFDIFNESVSIEATAIEVRAKSQKTDNPKMTKTSEQHTLKTEDLLKELPLYPYGV